MFWFCFFLTNDRFSVLMQHCNMYVLVFHATSFIPFTCLSLIFCHCAKINPLMLQLISVDALVITSAGLSLLCILLFFFPFSKWSTNSNFVPEISYRVIIYIYRVKRVFQISFWINIPQISEFLNVPYSLCNPWWRSRY